MGKKGGGGKKGKGKAPKVIDPMQEALARAPGPAPERTLHAGGFGLHGDWWQSEYHVECPNGRGETNLKYSDQPTKALTCGDAEDKAREMHAAFLRAYPEIDPAAFPLQRLRTDNWERPFENA